MAAGTKKTRAKPARKPEQRVQTDRLLSIEEIVELGNFGLRTVERWFAERRFPVVKFDRMVRVRESDFNAFLDSLTIRGEQDGRR